MKNPNAFLDKFSVKIHCKFKVKSKTKILKFIELFIENKIDQNIKFCFLETWKKKKHNFIRIAFKSFHSRLLTHM